MIFIDDVAEPPFFQGFQSSAPSSSPMSSARTTKAPIVKIGAFVIEVIA